MVFLNIFDDSDVSAWPAKLSDSRQKYNELRDKYLVDPHALESNQNEVLFDPLTNSEDNPWSKYFSNSKLEKLINQDISRTYPDRKFFIREDVQKMMLNVLFIYAREHEEVRYKQGMHELLAPIIYTREREKLSVDEEELTNKTLGLLLDSRYVEHDSFVIFDSIMNFARRWFISLKVKKEDHSSDLPDVRETINCN
eukprot:TRINITY_DN11969_c0_g1_i1.p1 TRINITY_DN11969_c0_g1~~TRINITY_DN11969_c0_g1_i1.p1  ORF type:complete len:197 (-),score=26.72 TRINITY_DN11969_c0_g1_i1:17-607(-)